MKSKAKPVLIQTFRQITSHPAIIGVSFILALLAVTQNFVYSTVQLTPALTSLNKGEFSHFYPTIGAMFLSVIVTTIFVLLIYFDLSSTDRTVKGLYEFYKENYLKYLFASFWFKLVHFGLLLGFILSMLPLYMFTAGYKGYEKGAFVDLSFTGVYLAEPLGFLFYLVALLSAMGCLALLVALKFYDVEIIVDSSSARSSFRESLKFVNKNRKAVGEYYAIHFVAYSMLLLPFYGMHQFTRNVTSVIFMTTQIRQELLVQLFISAGLGFAVNWVAITLLTVFHFEFYKKYSK